MPALEQKKISHYLLRIIGSYLSERRLVIEEGEIMTITAGVPQGSILGPLLWNIMYDGVLRLAFMEGVEAIAYADDLMIIAEAAGEQTLMDIVDDALAEVNTWMRKMQLTLAPDKSEAILIIRRRRMGPVTFKLGEAEIHPKDEIKYLGVILDKRLRFGKHLIYTTSKANVTTAALSRIMPRMGGSSEAKIKTLAAVAESVMLYASPVWGHILEVQKYKNIALRTQRKMALRVCRGYRTISTTAANILARIISIDLLVEERNATIGRTEGQKKDERKNTIAKWQGRWTTSGEDVWLHRLIPDLTPWFFREHGEITYHLTQVLTSHGCFQKYLHRIGKMETDICLYCYEEADDANHTLFVCNRWQHLRGRMEDTLDCIITSENVMEQMLMDERRWTCVTNMIEEIMRKKEEDEKTGIYNNEW